MQMFVNIAGSNWLHVTPKYGFQALFKLLNFDVDKVDAQSNMLLADFLFENSKCIYFNMIANLHCPQKDLQLKNIKFCWSSGTSFIQKCLVHMCYFRMTYHIHLKKKLCFWIDIPFFPFFLLVFFSRRNLKTEYMHGCNKSFSFSYWIEYFCWI